MNALFNFISPEFVEAFGWTIMHSLWQGILIAGAIVVIFSLMHRNSAQVKYLIGYFGLLLMLGWSAVTFVNAFEYATEKNALKQNLASTPGFARVYLEEQLLKRTVENQAGGNSINLNTIKLRSFFQRNFHIVVLFWMAGFLFLVLRMAGGLLYNHKLRTRRLVEVDKKWADAINEYATRLNIKRNVEAFFSPLVRSPLALGVFKPVILFPVAAFTGLSVRDVEAILAHELAHIARRDYLFNIIQSVIGLIYFYHPGVWLISSLINAERENSCDNIAIGLTGDKKGYIRTLAQVEINRNENQNLAMAFASRKGSVLSRIKHIQKQKAMKTNFIEGLIAAAVVVTGFILVSFTVGNSMHTQMSPNEGPAMEIPEGGNMPEQSDWTEQEIDSLKTSVKKQLAEKEDVEKVSKEVERMVEVAMSENNPELQAEIMAEVNRALAEIDIDAVVREAMREASKAIKEAQVEISTAHEDIDREEIKRDMDEARRDIEEARREVNEEMRRELENTEGMSKEMIELSIKAANAGIDIASAVVNNIDIDAIVNGALSGVGAALDALSETDLDSIEANDTLTQEDIDELEKLLEAKEQKLKEEKKKLKAKEKELKNK